MSDLITRLATNQSDIDAQAVMNAQQVSKRFGGLPLGSLPDGETTLEADRHYVFITSKVIDLPTITEAIDGSMITILQLAGTSTISYVIGADTYTFVLDAAAYGSTNGAWIQFRARYSETEAECLWYNITRNFGIDGLDTSYSNFAPIGSILYFPEESNIPTDYMECDGRSLSRDTYSELFARIGVKFGNTDGDHFNIPDYRGQFLRSWDHGAGIDPDTATRTDRGDGETGDLPGTKQTSEFGEHHHTVYARDDAGTGDSNGAFGAYPGFAAQPTVAETYIETGSDGSELIGDSGGAETRPTNVNVVTCIKVSNLAGAVSPEVECVLVRGMTATGGAYFNATTMAAGADSSPASDNEIHYRDTIDAAHDTVFTTPASEYGWANFFPYRPSADTSKTVLTYTSSAIDNLTVRDVAKFQINIDWQEATYDLLIEVDDYLATNGKIKSIFQRGLEFGTLNTIDVGTFDGDVTEGNTSWTAVDPSIQISSSGIIRLPIWTTSSDDRTASVHMSIVNYKTVIGNTTEEQIADAVYDRMKWVQVTGTTDNTAPSGEPDGGGTAWSAIGESLSQSDIGYYKYNLDALTLAEYIDPTTITEVMYRWEETNVYGGIVQSLSTWLWDAWETLCYATGGEHGRTRTFVNTVSVNVDDGFVGFYKYHSGGGTGTFTIMAVR